MGSRAAISPPGRACRSRWPRPPTRSCAGCWPRCGRISPGQKRTKAMHESALMRSLIRQVEAVAQAQGGGRVVEVTLAVGAWAAVTPAHLQDHFRLAAAGTMAAGAILT